MLNVFNRLTRVASIREKITIYSENRGCSIVENFVFPCNCDNNYDHSKNVQVMLEYCTPIWSFYLLKDINKIESVQRYFTRRLLPDKHYSYAERLVLTNLDTLESRRIKSDVIMCFKIINNLVDIDPSNFFNFNPNPHNTRGHSLKLTKQIYTSNSLANSFVNRCVNCWNALPSSTVLSPTLSQFKTLIN